MPKVKRETLRIDRAAERSASEIAKLAKIDPAVRVHPYVIYGGKPNPKFPPETNTEMVEQAALVIIPLNHKEEHSVRRNII